MTEDTITVGEVTIPWKEYIELCDQARESRIEEWGEESGPLRDYAFQAGYIRGVLKERL